ncbi:MAG TPA: response regulator [Candidatus Sulfotelmatobacter sp.]|nr:response regulator [Candidatus Sulfotelmatobacter sp.]HUB96324.1 response regulator [Stellaceae bacterium]
MVVTKRARAKRSGQDQPLISVIDDDVSVREATTGLLKLMGFEVEAFSSALDFLAFPRLDEIACVVADIHMPRMTGIELHDRLLASGHGIPTILITAYPNEDVRARALANGVFGYLTKPFDEEALLGCIRAALEAPSQ